MRYVFEDCALDGDRRELRRGADLVSVEPQVFDLLIYLICNRERVVSKDDLLASIWRGRIVSESTLNTRISTARSVIGDNGDDQRLIKTLPRKGIRFVGCVQEEQECAAVLRHQTELRNSTSEPLGTYARMAAEHPTFLVPDRPSIAVLPFANMSGDPEQEYFSDGITGDIITDLSKISGLFVVARNTTFTYKGRPVNVQQVSQELRVKFILEGCVRKAGSRVRVTVQLVAGTDSAHLWADRYDRDLTDIFAIQDEITHTIVDQLKVKLLPEERRAIDRAPTENVEAYAYYLRGRQFLHRSKSYLLLAKRMFAKAIELDPLYARAYAGMADCDSFLFLHYDADISIDDILATSAKALELERGLAEAHASRGLALSLHGRYSEAMADFDQAIALDPNLFEAHYFRARACVTQGRLDEAARHFERAAVIKPDDYQALIVVTWVYRSLGRERELKTAAREGVARAEREFTLHPENPRPAYLGAVGLAALGELDRAKEWAARALAIDPDDALAQYSVACSCSLVGEHERAIDLLMELLPRAGCQTREWVKHDSDLNPIRSHPRFPKILELLE